MEKLINNLPCGHCDDGVEIDGDVHVWDDNSRCFCPRKLKLVALEGLTIGLNQQVYLSQWRDNYVVCAKCGQLMGMSACWLDADGSQRHRACLDVPR